MEIHSCLPGLAWNRQYIENRAKIMKIRKSEYKNHEEKEFSGPRYEFMDRISIFMDNTFSYFYY